MKVIFFILISLVITQAQDLLSQQKTERLFKTGVDLLNKNQFGAARENFQEFLANSASSNLKTIDAEYYVALCAINLYHTDGEKLVADFVTGHASHPKAATANFDLANFFYQEKNYKKASTYYGKVYFESLSPEQQNMSRFRAGYSSFNQKFLKDALDQFNYVKGQGGQFGPAASYYAGFIEYGQSDYSNALIDLKRAEQNESYSKVVPYVIANVYYKQKSYLELITYASSVKSKEGVTNQDEIALLSAEAYFKKEDYNNAVDAYAAYLANKEDGDKGVLFRAGYAAYMIGQDASALKYLKLSFTDRDSIGFYSAYYLGSLYLKQQQKPMALTAFDIARKYLPDQKLVEEASFQYAKVAYDMGKPDQAIAEFENILKKFPASSHVNEIKELLSQAYVNASNYNKAIEYIESLPKKSVAIERAYQKATMLKGLDQFNKDSYDEAILLFEKSLQNPIDSDFEAESNYWCGEAYSIQKKYDKAIPHYHKVVEQGESRSGDLLAKARYGLGYCYFNLKQYDRALFNFKELASRSNKSYPNLADGTLRLADCYYVSKSYQEALQNYKNAILLNTSDKDYAHLQSGIVLGILRRYAEASVELDIVIKTYSQSNSIDEALFQRAQIDFDQGNYLQAVTGYTKLISSYPASGYTPYAYTRRAASNYNLKDYNKTSEDYITVLTKFSSHPSAKDVLLPLQESLNLAGRSAEFDKYFSSFKSANPDAKGIESVEFESAKNLYFNQDYKRAITNLGNYILQYPESAKLIEAKYYQAESYYRTKDLAYALAAYYSIETEKSFSFMAKVIGRIAEIEFKQGRYEKAIPQFHQLAKAAANKKDQYAAWNGLMESHFLMAQYDSAKLYAEIILDKGNINAGAVNKASLYLGKIAQQKGDFETAKDEYLSTLNAAHDEYGAEAKYYVAEIFYQTKEYKQCYETLLSLNTDFSSYTEWVGKSYLLLSDNFVAMGDPFNAKAVLKSLIDNFPLEDVKITAKARLTKMDQAELSKQEKIKADTVDND